MKSLTAVFNSILSQHVAVLGKTGSGKTSTAKLLIEHVVADGARVCVLDPIKSDWWGLTSSADGKKPGLPFHILGGPRGHVPLHAAAGKAIAEIVANGSLPLSIIDMAEFKPGGHSQFFTDFAPTLLKKMRGVLYLVIEEAHEFAPKERSGMRDENMAIHYAKRLATAGRSKGVRLIVATQRTQALHNAILGSCDTLITHRLTAPADQKPILDWLKANTDRKTADEVAGSLASLKTGEAWLCSGEAQAFERIRFSRITTYDNTATPTGDGAEHQVRTAAVDADKLRAIIGEAVMDAEQEDPRALRKQIADLKQELKYASATDHGAVERAVSAAVAERDRHWQGEVSRLERHASGLTGRLQKIGELAHLNGDATVAVTAPPAVHSPVYKPARKATRSPQPVSSPSAASLDKPLGKCERAILQVLAQHPEGCDSGKLTLLAGYRFSGGFRNSLSTLRSAGLIVGENGGTMQITGAGLEMGPFDPLPEGDALIDYWLTHPSLGKCEREILRALINASTGLDKDELCGETGYEFSGGFRNSLSKLRTAGLIDGRNNEVMRASQHLLEL